MPFLFIPYNPKKDIFLWLLLSSAQPRRDFTYVPNPYNSYKSTRL
jgi:hypothetical protein